MNTLNTLLIETTILLFPLIINLFYCTYSNNIYKEQNKTFLDFALLSSLYLLIIYNNLNTNIMILFNVPLIISFIKKRTITSLIMSVIIILIYYDLGANIIIILFEYIVYFLLYLFQIKKESTFLTLIFIFKIIYSFVFYKYYLTNFWMILLVIIITIIIIYMYKKGEDIIKLHMSIKELKKEEQIRTSLFKITHEIKNPIAVCKSYLDMFDINNKEHEKYIFIIKEEIDRILLLLQDFLSMNKIKIQKEILDVNLLLEDISDQFKFVLKEKNIKLDCSIPDDEIFIEGDYNRLSQVMINMIKNCIEALEETKTAVIKISCNVKDKCVITIEDNGTGINEDDIEKIKEPFYTTKKNGTGLGVSLSIEIIIAHNGNIEYIPLKKGTKVIITLPIYELSGFDIN